MSKQIKAVIKKKTIDALLLKVQGYSNPFWIPRSTILNGFDPLENRYQSFKLKDWICEKKGIKEEEPEVVYRSPF